MSVRLSSIDGYIGAVKNREQGSGRSEQGRTPVRVTVDGKGNERPTIGKGNGNERPNTGATTGGTLPLPTFPLISSPVFDTKPPAKARETV